MDKSSKVQLLGKKWMGKIEQSTMFHHGNMNGLFPVCYEYWQP